MSEPGQERRRHRRHSPDPTALRLRFSFPDETGHRYEAALRDVSVSGISFLLEKQHPDFVAGDTLKAVELEILGSALHGEVVVMHAMRYGDGTGYCGGLYFPRTDDDLLTMRRICGSLEEAADLGSK